MVVNYLDRIFMQFVYISGKATMIILRLKYSNHSHNIRESMFVNTGVIGGALLMPVMGAIVDDAGVIVALCAMFVFYAYIIWFCNFGSKIGLR